MSPHWFSSLSIRPMTLPGGAEARKLTFTASLKQRPSKGPACRLVFLHLMISSLSLRRFVVERGPCRSPVTSSPPSSNRSPPRRAPAAGTPAAFTDPTPPPARPGRRHHRADRQPYLPRDRYHCLSRQMAAG